MAHLAPHNFFLNENFFFLFKFIPILSDLSPPRLLDIFTLNNMSLFSLSISWYLIVSIRYEIFLDTLIN